MDVRYYHTSTFALYLRESNIPNAGLGVFTDQTIPPNTMIDEYKGTVSRFAGGSYTLEINNGYRINAVDFPRCYMGMINDCSHIVRKYRRKKGRNIDITPAAYYGADGKPLEINCEFILAKDELRAYVYSIKEIHPGQELFLSYGEDYWK